MFGNLIIFHFYFVPHCLACSEGQQLSGKIQGAISGGACIYSEKYLLCTGLRSVLSEYFPEKTKPSERRKANQSHPKRAERQRRKPRNTPEEKKRTPKLQGKGRFQKSHKPSIAMKADLAILKLDR